MSSLVVHSPLGAGAYGQVYHATWKGRKVAVKKFFVAQNDVHQTAAIQREVELLQTLIDRHIIQFYGTTSYEGMLVLIMDYAEGGSLQGAIASRRLSDWPTKTRIAHEIARGLAYIHHEGVIHRDLKSLNVLLTRHMEVKLCDFGLATVKVRSAAMSTTLKGTFRWMAPELFALKPKYSAKSDMYALGMVMWEMAANSTMPFKDQLDNHTVMTFVTKGEREELPDETPSDYRKWVERCWAHNPLERPDASEMVVEDDAPDTADGLGSDMTMMSLSNIPGMTISMVSSVGASSTGSSTIGASSVGTDMTSDAASQPPPNDLSEIQKLAKGGHLETQMTLACMYENGVGVAQDDFQALTWYLRAAKQGSVEAQYKTGYFYYRGIGTQVNIIKAESWLRQAAEGGNREAQRYLGRMYEHGHKGKIPQDYAKAVSWYRMAAEQGDAPSQCLLGNLYAEGRGVEQDNVQAVSWYLKAAEQGDPIAQCNLGIHYENGEGVKQDYVVAVAWYLKAAEQGVRGAQNNLGTKYERGAGVEQDDTKAAMWYLKAAKQGSPSAQCNIGRMYENGLGVPQDDDQAIF
ncbi:hypothetical protein DFQ27_001558, partial [Actinomortierella ambigua]